MGYTTGDLQVRYIRAMGAATGQVLAEGRVVHAGKRSFGRSSAGSRIVRRWWRPVVVATWAAEELYASEEYRPYREARRQGARNAFLLIAGEDVNGVAQIAE
ncbi:MAG TPA: hypothetical protein VHT29_02205 [Solirubrobacteraceae bacterium]|nr:hypothetical protein [Solirubrobacteraceae bacterium]